MYGRRGHGYDGADSIKTTSTNMEEIIDLSFAKSIANNIDGFYKFYLDNKSNCTIFINNLEHGIFLEAGDGYEIDKEDAIIFSIKIKESGSSYKWSGHF